MSDVSNLLYVETIQKNFCHYIIGYINRGTRILDFLRMVP